MVLDGFEFDPNYFKKVPMGKSPYGDWSAEGEAIQFRIVKMGWGGATRHVEKEKFITLYNCHNGYYGKGFKFTVPVDPTKNQESTI